MGKLPYAEHVKKSDTSVIIAEIVFKNLKAKHRCAALSEVVETASGGTPNRSTPHYYDGTIPWLKSGELNDGYINNSEEFISEEGLNNSAAKVFPKYTLLVAMYGATAGKTAILNIDAATNQAICGIFPKNHDILTEYLYWFFRAHRYYFIDISRGGAQPNISQTKINETPIPIIDKIYQEKIALFLKTIEQRKLVDCSLIPEELREPVKKAHEYLVCLQTLNVENTSQSKYLSFLRQSILQEAIEGKLTAEWRKQNTALISGNNNGSKLLEKIKAEKERLVKQGKLKKDKPPLAIADEEKPFAQPEEWAWGRLGDVCTKIGSGSTPKGSNYSQKGIPFFRSQNVHDSGIIYKDIKFISDIVNKQMSGTIVLPFDLLLNITGGSIGRCALVPGNFNKGNVSQHVCIIRVVGWANAFAHKIVLSPLFQKMIFQSTTGSGREGLPKYNLEQFVIPLPPLAEQQAIVQKVDQLTAIINDLEKQVTDRKVQAEMLMQSVLREAFA